MARRFLAAPILGSGSSRVRNHTQPHADMHGRAAFPIQLCETSLREFDQVLYNVNATGRIPDLACVEAHVANDQLGNSTDPGRSAEIEHP